MVWFLVNFSGIVRCEKDVGRLEGEAISGREVRDWRFYIRGEIFFLLVVNRKGKERIYKRDILKKKRYILVIYCSWKWKGEGKSFVFLKLSIGENGNEGWGIVENDLLIEIGVLGREKGLREDNLDILRFRGKFRV